MLKRGRRSSSSSLSRKSESGKDYDFNPHSEDNMVSSQGPSLGHKVVPNAPITPAYLPNHVPSTNGPVEVLRR